MTVIATNTIDAISPLNYTILSVILSMCLYFLFNISILLLFLLLFRLNIHVFIIHDQLEGECCKYEACIHGGSMYGKERNEKYT